MKRPDIRPWITPTDQEQFDGTFGYDGERVFIPGVERDEKGILWQPMPDNPDKGRVLWKDMHTGRQRLAMVDGRCQVCGRVMPERPLTWLIPGVEARVRRPNGRPITTASPPTCRTCIEVSKMECPNLSASPPVLLLVRHWRPVSVFGDMVTQDGRHVKADIPLGSPDVVRVMARHLIVELYDYRRAKVQ